LLFGRFFTRISPQVTEQQGNDAIGGFLLKPMRRILEPLEAIRAFDVIFQVTAKETLLELAKGKSYLRI
jgi:hypothetical protein